MNKFYNIVAKIIATGFGLGYSPVIPGTIGSLLGIAIFYIFLKLRLTIAVWIILIICLFFVGVLTSNLAEKLFVKKDSRRIVIDEITGCIIFLLLVPWRKWCIIVGFILYRILDIIKPYPAHSSQRLPGGWGIMIDDLIVGIYTAAIINTIIWIEGLLY